MSVSEVHVSGDICQLWQAFPSGKRKSYISSEVVHVENLFAWCCWVNSIYVHTHSNDFANFCWKVVEEKHPSFVEMY